MIALKRLAAHSVSPGSREEFEGKFLYTFSPSSVITRSSPWRYGRVVSKLCHRCWFSLVTNRQHKNKQLFSPSTWYWENVVRDVMHFPISQLINCRHISLFFPLQHMRCWDAVTTQRTTISHLILTETVRKFLDDREGIELHSRLKLEMFFITFHNERSFPHMHIKINYPLWGRLSNGTIYDLGARHMAVNQFTRKLYFLCDEKLLSCTEIFFPLFLLICTFSSNGARTKTGTEK